LSYSVFIEHPGDTIRRVPFANCRTTGNQEFLLHWPDAAAIQFSKKWKVNFRVLVEISHRDILAGPICSRQYTDIGSTGDEKNDDACRMLT
jgi:hypothetical protein